MLALDPPDAGGATIGGIVATRRLGAAARPLRRRRATSWSACGWRWPTARSPRAAARSSRTSRATTSPSCSRARSARSARSSRCRCGCTRCRRQTATAVGHSHDPDAARRAAPRRWRTPARAASASTCAGRAGRGHGARRASAARRRARRRRPPSGCCARPGLEAELVDDDERSGRPSARASARPAGSSCACRRCRPTSRRCCAAAERHGATLVGRAGLGLSWLRLDEGDARRCSSRAARRYVIASCSTARRSSHRRPARRRPTPRRRGARRGASRSASTRTRARCV